MEIETQDSQQYLYPRDLPQAGYKKRSKRSKAGLYSSVTFS